MSIFVFSRTKLPVTKIKQYHRKFWVGRHPRRPSSWIYCTHDILELSRTFRIVMVDDFIHHFILVLENLATLFQEETFRHSKKQSLLKISWTKPEVAVYLFPQGIWVEKTSNIPKHASTSQHVHMLGVTKFKTIVSLPNSPLFQVSNLKIEVFKRIRSGPYSTTYFYA